MMIMYIRNMHYYCLVKLAQHLKPKIHVYPVNFIKITYICIYLALQLTFAKYMAAGVFFTGLNRQICGDR